MNWITCADLTFQQAIDCGVIYLRGYGGPTVEQAAQARRKLEAQLGKQFKPTKPTMGVDYTPNAGHGYKIKASAKAEEEGICLSDIFGEGEDKALFAQVQQGWREVNEDGKPYAYLVDGESNYCGGEDDYYLVLADRNDRSVVAGVALKQFIDAHPLIEVDPEEPDFQHHITLLVW